ncbi:MAG: alpha/beta hydrolase [Boseongicola sp. SB0676_bin_33]|nr:alpha/beta hydrolase [Boseongicola sp. SB0676_bin_33]
MADFAISPDGTRIAHETGGSGAPLILVHGASGDRTSTPALLASLEETHAVTRYDRRGRGESEDSGAYDFLAEADDLRAVIAAAADRADRPVVFGISMGARIALELLRDPPDLAAMVLWEPPATDRVDPAFARGLSRVRDAMEADGAEAATVLHSRLFHKRTPQDIEELKRDEVRWKARVENMPVTLREMEAVHRDCLFVPRNYTEPEFGIHLMSGDRTLPFLQASSELIGSLGFVQPHVLRGQNHSAPGKNPSPVLKALLEAVPPDRAPDGRQ